MDWEYQGRAYTDAHLLAADILKNSQPAHVGLEPLVFRVTWKEVEQTDRPDWDFIVRNRTIKLEPSIPAASAYAPEQTAALLNKIGVITTEHEVAYANLKPSAGEIVNQAQCEQYFGDLLKRAHEFVHEVMQET